MRACVRALQNRPQLRDAGQRERPAAACHRKAHRSTRLAYSCRPSLIIACIIGSLRARENKTNEENGAVVERAPLQNFARRRTRAVAKQIPLPPASLSSPTAAEWRVPRARSVPAISLRVTEIFPRPPSVRRKNTNKSSGLPPTTIYFKRKKMYLLGRANLGKQVRL